ncbi:MAG: hypothetical protein IKC07_03355 [Clostridia bacterium]|nr:hypothetical protein [Clostridia bacterium]
MVEKLPKSVRAVTIPFENNQFYIFVNSVYTEIEREKILQEEKEKINNIREKG